MRVERVDENAYQKFLDDFQGRYYMTQMTEYGRMRAASGAEVDYLLIRDGDRTVGGCVAIYRSFQKLFRKADCVFGPVLEEMDENRYREAMEALTDFITKPIRVRGLVVNPLIEAARYDDIEKSEDGLGDFACRVLEDLGYRREQAEWYENDAVQVRFVYVKDLDGMDYDEVLKSVLPGIRQRIRQAEFYRYQVKMLGDADLDIFLDMLRETYRIAEENGGPHMEVRESYFRNVLKYYGDKVLFPLSYLDCDASLEVCRSEFERIDAEIDELEARHAEGMGDKKYGKLRRELDNQRAAVEKRHTTMTELKETRGNEVPLASGCFFCSGQDLIYMSGAGDHELDSLHGTMALHGHMLQLALEKGLRYYNMFGCTGITTEDAPDYYVLNFKRKFKGRMEEYIGTWEK